MVMSVIGLELLPGTVADVKHVDLLLLLHDAVDYAVHVRLVAKEQVSVVTVFWRHRAAVGAASQGSMVMSVIGLEFLPGTVADVKHVDLLLLLHDAVDYAVHVRLVAKEQVYRVI